MTLTCPPNQTAVSADGSPVVVVYPKAMATGGPLPVSVLYSQSSGTLFPVGSTTIKVTATWANGKTKTCSFMVTVSVGVPPIPGPVPGPVPVPTPPTPTPPPSTGVITPANLHYMGAIRLQQRGAFLEFSFGGLAVRKINGKTRFLIPQDANARYAPVEFESPAEYDHTGTLVSGTALTPNYASTSVAPLVANWGLNNDGSLYDCYHGIAGKWYDGSGSAFNDMTWYGGGGGAVWNCFHENGRLHIMYGALYGKYHEWGHCFITLDNPNTGTGPVTTAYGPFNVESPAPSGTRGLRCASYYLKTHDGGYGHGGAQAGSYQQGAGPDGPTLFTAFTPPTQATPAGYPNVVPTLSKGLVYYTLNGFMNPADGSLPVGQPIWSFRQPGYPYAYEPSQGAHLAINPNLNGGIGTWNETDGLAGMIYANANGTHGYIAMMAKASNHTIGSYQTGCTFNGHTVAHSWYAAGGNQFCAHGCESPVMITGPVATHKEVLLVMYDPAKIDQVKAGTRVDYSVDPDYYVYPTDDINSNIQLKGIDLTGPMLSGMATDETNNMFYVLALQADLATPGFFFPLIYAFQVR